MCDMDERSEIILSPRMKEGKQSAGDGNVLFSMPPTEGGDCAWVVSQHRDFRRSSGHRRHGLSLDFVVRRDV